MWISGGLLLSPPPFPHLINSVYYCTWRLLRVNHYSKDKKGIYSKVSHSMIQRKGRMVSVALLKEAVVRLIIALIIVLAPSPFGLFVKKEGGQGGKEEKNNRNNQ
jgi:hypothetical protein